MTDQREKSKTATTRRVRLCTQSDVPEGEAKSFAVGSRKIAVYHTRGEFYASRDLCTHENQPLADGWLEGETIECPWHGAQFCLKTGEALSLPATKPLELFEVELDRDDVWVHLPESDLETD